MIAHTSNGWREHRIAACRECWCCPKIEQVECDNCGGTHAVIYHNQVVLRADVRPRMTVFSSP